MTKTLAQPALVPMDDDEMLSAARLLAKRIEELADLKTDHALQKAEMRAQEQKLEEQIRAIAQTIRTQGR